ncbi:hypothetical protein AAOGI_13620 [Agarivorans albus]
MKAFYILALSLMLGACASNDTGRTVPSVSETNNPVVKNQEPAELYSDRYFVNYANALNQHTENALRSKIDEAKMVEKLETDLAFTFNANQRANVTQLLSSLTDTSITAILAQPGGSWKYVDSDVHTKQQATSYYRFTLDGTFAYYEISWLDGHIVDIFNLFTGVGISDSFDLVIDMEQYRKTHPNSGIQRMGDFFEAVRQASYTEMLFAYNEIPKPFQQKPLVLAGLMKAYINQPSLVMPRSFVVYMEKHQPVHPRFYAYYYDNQQFDLAIESLKRFPETVVKDVRVQVEIGNALYESGQTEKAEDYLVNALLKAPSEPFGYIWLLGLSIDTKQYQQTELILKVLYDRFETRYSKTDLLTFDRGEEYLKSASYQRYKQYLN